MILTHDHLKIWAVLLFVFLAGCNTIFKDVEREGEPEFNLTNINIILDQDANNTSATAVDLVVTYKPELMKALTKMTAEDYFKVAEQIRRERLSKRVKAEADAERVLTRINSLSRQKGDQPLVGNVIGEEK